MFTIGFFQNSASAQEACEPVNVFTGELEYGSLAQWDSRNQAFVVGEYDSYVGGGAGFESLLRLGLDDFSFTVRFRGDTRNFSPTNVSPPPLIFDMRDHNEGYTRGIALYVTEGLLAFQMADGRFVDDRRFDEKFTNYITDEYVINNEWHTVTVRVDRSESSGGQIYLDGRRVLIFDPTAHRGSIGMDTPRIAIGQRTDVAAGNFVGQVSPVMFYDCALPLNEMMSAPVAILDSNPIVHITTPTPSPEERIIAADRLSIPDELADHPFIFLEPENEYGYGDMYLVLDSGTQIVPLTYDLYPSSNWSFSPDGRYMFFTPRELFSRRGMNTRLRSLGQFVYDLQTGELIRIQDTFPNLLGDIGYTSMRDSSWLRNDLLWVYVSNNNRIGLRLLDLTNRTALQAPYPLGIEVNGNRPNFIDIERVTDTRWLYTTVTDSHLRVHIYDRTERLFYALYNDLNAQSAFMNSAAVSRDGTRFVHRLFVDDTQTGLGIGTTDARSYETVYSYTPLAQDDEDEVISLTYAISNPRWSPNDNEIAFIQDGIVHLMNSDGSNVRALDVSPFLVVEANWLSENLLLATSAYGENGYALLNTDGEALGTITLDGEPIRHMQMLPANVDAAQLANINSFTIPILENPGLPPTPTPSPTITSLPTITPIPVTASATWTPTITSTPQPTLTPSNIPAITPTFTVTPTATASPTATNIPTATAFPLYCVGSPPSRMDVGSTGRTTISAPEEIAVDTRVRAQPGGEQVSSLPEGTAFTVIGGPECQNDLTWWQLQTLDGTLTGWSAEGLAPDDYFIEPYIP